MVLRLLIAGVLIAYGLIHLGLGLAPPPDTAGDSFWSYFLAKSWILERWDTASKRAVGFALLTASTIGFVGAGLALFAQLGWWRRAAIGVAAISLLLMGVFWHPAL